MASAVFKVGEPPHARNTNQPFAVVMRVVVAQFLVHLYRRLEVASSSDKRIVEPNPVRLDQREHLLVCDGVAVADDCEFLACFHYPRKELPEQRERRIGHDDIRLVTQLLHLAAAEVAVAVEVLPFDILEVHLAVTGHVMVEDEYLPALVLRFLT